MELAIFWIFCSVLTAAVASSKGRYTFGWFILGFFFSFLALIAVALMPSLKKDLFAPTPDTHVRCPDCREFVFMDASKCKHCGTVLTPTSSPPPQMSGAERFGRKLGRRFSTKK